MELSINHKVLIFLLINFAYLHHATCGVFKNTVCKTESQIIFDTIPEDERSYFITFHISKAIKLEKRTDIHLIPDESQVPQHLHDEYEKMIVPKQFSVDLLEWTERDFILGKNVSEIRMTRLDDTSRMIAPDSVICFPSGCVDPSDIGQICCPF